MPGDGSARPREAERQGQHRSQHQRSSHLDVEADADRGHRGAEQREPAGFGCPHPEPHAGQQHQDETALGIVGTVDGDIDRAERERQRGDSPSRPAPIFPHQNVNQEDRGQSRHHLGEQDRKRGKTEQLGAGDLQPDRHRRLVDGNKACGVERVEEEIVPATQHAAHAGGVVLPAKIVLRKLPGSRQHSHCRDERERQGRFQHQAAFNIWLSDNFRMRRSPRAGSSETITCGFRGQLTRGKIA